MLILDPSADTSSFVEAAITPEERHRMIAVAAYYRAEQHGFASGDPTKDWWEAAAEVDAMLATWGGARTGASAGQPIRNALRLWSD